MIELELVSDWIRIARVDSNLNCNEGVYYYINVHPAHYLPQL